MRTHNLSKRLHHIWKRFGAPVFVMAAVFCVVGATTDRASALYILTGAEDSAIVLDESAQVQDFSSQLVFLSTSSTGYDVTLAANQDVSISYDGETISCQSKRETISDLLSRMKIVPGPLDMVAVDLSGDSVVLTIDDQLTYYDQVSEVVSYETVRVANPDLPQGTEQVVQEGADGIRSAIYEVVWSGGEMVSRQFVEQLDSTAVDEIVEYGTSGQAVTASDRLVNVAKNSDGSGVLTFSSGTTLAFSSVKSMTATAYTAGYGGADYTTATGTLVDVGTVAVDKSVIPLGTEMYIVTNDGVVYGHAVAADTGVKGNKVDLYYDTYEQCINFGRRSCTVYILK